MKLFTPARVLGMIIILASLAMLFLDMYLHFLSETYGFDLKWWHVAGGLLFGSLLMLQPRKTLKLLNGIASGVGRLIGKK